MKVCVCVGWGVGGVCVLTREGKVLKELTFLTQDLAFVDNTMLPPVASTTQLGTEVFLSGFSH